MQRKGLFNFLKLLFAAISLKKIVFSYIGPGSGLSGLGAFIAVFLGLLTTIFGLIWYPIKRFLRRKKEDQEPDQIKDEE